MLPPELSSCHLIQARTSFLSNFSALRAGNSAQLSCVLVAQLCPTLCDLQASLSIEFSKQEYWSGLPFPSPEDLPDPGIEPTSPALTGRFFTTEIPGLVKIV